MQQLVLVLHVLVAICLIALVLLQHGKGADVGAAFGSGASNTMFGSTGSMPFLVKLTGVLAAVFFLTSLALGYFVGHQSKSTTPMQFSTQSQQQSSAPAPTQKNK